MKKIASIEGMSCDHCVAHVEKALQSVTGVQSVKVNLKKNQAEFKADGVDDQLIRDAVAEAGYAVTAISNA